MLPKTINFHADSIINLSSTALLDCLNCIIAFTVIRTCCLVKQPGFSLVKGHSLDPRVCRCLRSLLRRPEAATDRVVALVLPMLDLWVVLPEAPTAPTAQISRDASTIGGIDYDFVNTLSLIVGAYITLKMLIDCHPHTCTHHPTSSK
jgi:hypothetical protein